MAAPGGVDLVLGAHRDPAFGPVVLVGVGGIFVETLDDAVLALAPVDPGAPRVAPARRCAPGRCCRARAAPSRSTSAAVARAAAAVGDLLVASPGLAEVEVNPARATAAGVVALDARVVPAG